MREEEGLLFQLELPKEIDLDLEDQLKTAVELKVRKDSVQPLGW